MRRFGVVCVTVMLMLFLQTTAAFAVNLQVVNTHPRDGATGIYPLNAAIKIYFDRDVFSAREVEANTARFVVTDQYGNVEPIIVLHDPNNREMVLVVLENQLEATTQYTLTISGDFITMEGDILGDPYTVSFITRDMQRDMNISMIMMAVFFVILMFVSGKQMKRQAQKEAEENDTSKVNPYKVSKRTGKSVVEVVEKAEKQKKKKLAEQEKFKVKKSDEDDTDEDEYYYEEENDNYRVTEPKPIAEFSNYRTGRKAKAEAEARRKAAAGTTNPKHQRKAKNKKKK